MSCIIYEEKIDFIYIYNLYIYTICIIIYYTLAIRVLRDSIGTIL